jgi:formate dehydrogenase major subunit
MYGDAATKENQFGYDWHPKILGDHSHMAMFAAMDAGAVKDVLRARIWPRRERQAGSVGLRKLEWLVVKDNWLTETATFWKNAPEVKKGEVKTADIKTEVFFLPATQVAEVEGTFTNTQRLLQFHHKAAEAPGDCRSDTWFYYELGKRLKKLYANSTAPRDEGFKNLVWDYEHENENERKKGEPSALKILKELNGFQTDDPNKHVAGFGELKDDGSTTCASWIYSGVLPAADKNLADRRTPDHP